MNKKQTKRKSILKTMLDSDATFQFFVSFVESKELRMVVYTFIIIFIFIFGSIYYLHASNS